MKHLLLTLLIHTATPGSPSPVQQPVKALYTQRMAGHFRNQVDTVRIYAVYGQYAVIEYKGKVIGRSAKRSLITLK